MRARTTRSLCVAALVSGSWAAIACGKVLGADFDDLVLSEDSGTGSGAMGAAGGTTGTGGNPMSDASSGGGVSGSGGVTGGSAGAGGMGGLDTGGTSGAGAGGIGGAGTGGIGGAGTGGTGGAGAGGVSGSDGGGMAGSGGTGGASGIVVNGVVINEARNSSGDFIELYNTDGVDFDLSGYALTDEGSGGSPDVAGAEAFPQGTVVPANGFLLVLCNMALTQGPTNNCSGLPAPCYHVTFGVNQGGETAFLLSPSSTVKDSTEVPGNLTASTTWGRYPDGVGGFDYMLATPKAPNSAP